jgi:hypothetical protein
VLLLPPIVCHVLQVKFVVEVAPNPVKPFVTLATIALRVSRVLHWLSIYAMQVMNALLDLLIKQNVSRDSTSQQKDKVLVSYALL